MEKNTKRCYDYPITKAEKEKENDIKVNTVNTLTINQIGEMSRYPDAMEIDGMECE